MGEVGGWMPSCFRLMDIPLQGHPHISTSAVWMHLLSQTCQPSLRSDKFKSDPDLTLNNSSTFQIQHDAVYLWQPSIALEYSTSQFEQNLLLVKNFMLHVCQDFEFRVYE